MRRAFAAGVVFGLLATACAAGGEPEALSFDRPGVLPSGPSALTDRDNRDLLAPRVDLEALVSEGPPPDGIPAIDAPKFRSIEDAELSLDETEPVIVLDIGGDARAYPVEIMMWHEIVNDVVGGVPVAVTYCPLCNSAVAYERTINDVPVTFGTSGELYASALVMYDRATESLWTHFDGRAIAGVLTGHRLDPVPSPLLAWSEFKAAYPDGQVLSRDTGFVRQYGRNPYFGYDDPDTRPFFLRGDVDERATVKQRVVGVELDGDAVAASRHVLVRVVDVSAGDGAVREVSTGRWTVLCRQRDAYFETTCRTSISNRSAVAGDEFSHHRQSETQTCL